MRHYLVQISSTDDTVYEKRHTPDYGRHAQVCMKITADVAVGPCKDAEAAIAAATSVMAGLHPYVRSFKAEAVQSSSLPIKLKERNRVSVCEGGAHVERTRAK